MTSGAANDIEKATQLARAMVVEFGMSALGPINFGPQYETGDFGAVNYYEPAQISPSMQEKVDNEIRKILDSGYKEALVIIKGETKKLGEVVEKLLEEETVTREVFEKIVGPKPKK